MWFNRFPQLSVSEIEDAYDYVIIGGGTAGCVLASRLSEDPDVSVLVLERGGLKDGWLSRIPLLSSHFASDGSRTRIWKSVPQKHVDGRVFEIGGGNSLGGASRINAMLYTRGLPAEYNSWSAGGRRGWSYDEMQQYFMKSETDLDQDPTHVDDYHGASGPWHNRSHKQSYWGHTDPIIRASESIGVPYVEDLNSPLHPPHGCAKMHFNIDSRGYRSSTFSAFLPYALANERKARLHICLKAAVLRIEVKRDENDVSRAEGVCVQTLDARSPARYVRARREVILTAGPIGSPHLLLLSGIGPERHLIEHGIPVIKNLPGVGSHLDHLGVAVQYRVPLEDSMVKLQVRPWTFIRELYLYILFGLGLLLAPVLDVSIFVQSRLFDSKYNLVTKHEDDRDASLPMNLPDIEVMPIAWSDVNGSTSVQGIGGLGFLTLTLRPTSTGTVQLASSDPRDEPIIDLNYFATEHDREVMRQAVKFVMRLKAQMAAQGYPISEYLVPASESDADIDAFVRLSCQTSYHYTSTCRMVPEADGASIGGVVDDTLLVHGVEGLRIADSSIFPHILSTHTAAATVAVAEKCADMIKNAHQDDIPLKSG